ncbi:MAG: hypothetical protein HDQ87_06640 [Clostridia bacterium]|nr:hypothetical protein [Clostridia bacterium]
MLKKICGAVLAALLAVSILPVSGLAVERYEVLQIGDEDAWVMELQEKLCELGYLQPPATGYYGTNTQKAVIAYQRDHGLTADGKAGPITRQSILGDSYQPILGPRDDPANVPSAAPAPSAEPSAPAPTADPGQDPGASEPAAPDASQQPSASTEPVGPAESMVPTAVPSAGPDSEVSPSAEPVPSASTVPAEPSASAEPDEDALKLGDRGDAVSDLQRRLKELEYYDYSQITGYFGPVTEESVKKFERTHSMELDGIMSAEELQFLNSEEVRFYTMFPGDQGDDIYAMQERLIKLGYMESEATGYYGTATTLAVRLFQETNGLVADGTAGKETRALLYSDKAIMKGHGNPEDEEDNPPGEDSVLSSGVAKLLEVAQSQTGKRYVYGASGPNAYDCSGFVYYAMKGAGLSVSRMSSAGYATVSSWETIKKKADLQIGDLVFFKSDSSSSISHVGIYIGGGNIIHAAPSIGGVGVSSMASGYYSRNFVTAKRIF